MRLRRTLLTDPRRSHNGRCVHIHEKNVEHRPKGNRDIDKMLCDHQAIKTIKEMVCILSVHPIDHRFLAIRFAVQWKLADTSVGKNRQDSIARGRHRRGHIGTNWACVFS